MKNAVFWDVAPCRACVIQVKVKDKAIPVTGHGGHRVVRRLGSHIF
jgi:hypothetical protein